MKKVLSTVLAAMLCLVLALTVMGCGKDVPEPTAAPTAEPTATPKPVITEDQVDVLAETWVACELTFKTTKEYQISGSKASIAPLVMDVVFTNRETGKVMTIPAFWYASDAANDNTFMVRFAGPEYGIWDYKTVCAEDADLDGKTGTVGVNTYTGDLEIYKHGFVTVDPTKKYFTYADGTPFFYLGDTHWGMYSEEFDKAGNHAKDIKTDSHFKYIVDKRVEQGFTVYQSEPISSPFDFANGLQKGDLKGLIKADGYYQYIADKGLSHSNACLFYSSTMSRTLAKDEALLKTLSRYWVARFGAYPVVWTLAQEIDNDFYHERGDQTFYNPETNPWVKVAEFMHECDAYQHPLSGHQENVSYTTVTGAGTSAKNRDNNGASAFLSDEITKKTGHNFWAAQWSPSLTGQASQEVAEDYWKSPKVAIDYEGRYCYLWTKNFGARAQGWIAYLSGMYGYGYGAIDMWLYNSSYNVNEDSSDGVDTITKADKKVHWGEAIEFESAYQVGYMRKFFETIEWWKLIPDFNNKTKFNPASDCVYTCATDGNDMYVLYLYAANKASGTLVGVNNDATYTVKWFNPRTNEYGTTITDAKGSNGALKLDDKPDDQDWVVLVTINK